MSTPSGKPFDPIDDPPHRSQTASDKSRGQSQHEDDPVRSPYAPKRARLLRALPRAEAKAPLVDLPRFLLGADQLRTDPAESRPASRASELPSNEPSKANGEQQGDPAAPPFDGGQEPPFAREAASEDSHTSTQATQASAETHPPSQGAERPKDKPSGAGDIERLEASLRWLNHQSAELRRPYADQLTPPAARQSAASTGEGAAVKRSLEPETLVAPALMRAQRRKMDGPLATIRGPLLILVAGLIAAPAVYFIAGRSAPAPDVPREAPKLAAAEPQATAPPLLPALQKDGRSNEHRADDVATAPNGETSDDPAPVLGAAVSTEPMPQASSRAIPAGDENIPVPPASRSEIRVATAISPVSRSEVSVPPATLPVSRSEPSVSPVSPPAPPATRSDPPVSPPAPPIRRVDPADIELLVKQGEQFMAVGDVAAARIVFQRAAQAGDAAAALAMGATYDPLVLNKIGVVGVTADPDKARGWYVKAQQLGSPEAPRRLELLAHR